MRNGNNERGVFDILDLLGLLYIGVILCKICGVITIPWLYILIPVYIPFVAAGITCIIVLIVWVIDKIINR